VLLLVPDGDEAATSVATFFDDVEFSRVAGDTVGANESRSEKYLLLGEIDFTHPLFAPFASPRYSDFTKIHFWKHRVVTLKPPATTRVVARFDNGDPALLERSVGKGRVLAMTSGWQPADSQLALSSKGVPLVGALLDLACGGTEVAEGVAVGQPMTLPSSKQPEPIVVQTPDGREVRLESDAATFAETDRTGIYRAKVGSTETRFAVNLSPSESLTTPMDLEQLEQRGVRIGTELTRTQRIDRVRQQRDTELESRQKVWRWLIVVALGLLALETWWAGRAERKIAVEQM